MIEGGKMIDLNTQNRKAAIGAISTVIFVLFLRLIPLFIHMSKAIEQALPLIVYLAIPILCIHLSRETRSNIGLSSFRLRLKDIMLIIVFSLPLPLLAISIHSIVEKMPINMTPWVFEILAILVLIQSPLHEFFWRGFVQKRLEGAFRTSWYAIPITAILTAVVWIPVALSWGGGEQYMAIGAKFLESILLGCLFFKTKKLSTAILGRMIIITGIAIAHSNQIVNMIIFQFGPPL
jgi:membrane protease YdiL (CAAX protease family)